jgi:hypothetical protein
MKVGTVSMWKLHRKCQAILCEDIPSDYSYGGEMKHLLGWWTMAVVNYTKWHHTIGEKMLQSWAMLLVWEAVYILTSQYVWQEGATWASFQ